jgi:hypothetical protein
MRASYRNDVAFFIRFSGAVEKDTRRSPEWRRRVSELVRKLVMECLLADKEDGAASAEPPPVEMRRKSR